MMGETTTENEVEADGHGDRLATPESAPLERRPSLMKLQFMLKKVSQSPFHNQHKPEDPLTGPPAAVPAVPGVTTDPQLHLRQNGLGGHLTGSNPFYRHYLESSSNGYVKEDVASKTSQAYLDSIFVPPPEFQSLPLALGSGIKTVQNGTSFSEPPEDLFQNLPSYHMQGDAQPPTLAQNTTTNGIFHEDTPDKPEHQTLNFSNSLQYQNSNLLKNEEFNSFHVAEGQNLSPAECTKKGKLLDTFPSYIDPFTSLPSNKEVDPLCSPEAVVTNPFHRATTKAAGLFQADPTNGEDVFGQRQIKQDTPMKDDLFGMSSPFLPSSAHTVNPFSSPIAKDLFQDFTSVDDPFRSPFSKQDEAFNGLSNGTPDIFQPLSSETQSKDLFETPISNTSSMANYGTPLLKSSSEMKMDMFSSSPDLFKEIPSKSHAANQSLSEPLDVVLTTPQGTKQNILQPTPFTRARNLRMPPGQSPPAMMHVSTFKRPPKPLPRTRPPQKEKPPVTEKPPVPERPPKPEKPTIPAHLIEPKPVVPKTSPKPSVRALVKPVIRRKPKTPESKPVDSENFVVFQDILLIGQEKCVEDWPEDSPELNPNFKPSGALRLRRESLKMKADSDGGSGEDQDGFGNKKKDNKFKMSLLSRRGSKDKFSDDAKEGRSRTLSASRKSSKDYSSDLHMSAEENEEEQSEYKKKPLKTKVNQLLRRASYGSSVSEGKHMNGHLHQESKDGDINNKSVIKKDSFRRWSEGTVLDASSGDEDEEEGQEAKHEKKKKKKVKIKFVPHRGFAITLEKPDDLRGAHGYTPSKGSKDGVFEDVGELHSQNYQSSSMAAFHDEEPFQRALQTSDGVNRDENINEMEDCKPKKPTKKKLLHVGRRSTKNDMWDNISHDKKKSSFSAEELDYDELNGMEDCKPKMSKHKGLNPTPNNSKSPNGQSDSIGFSHHIPQQAPNVFAEDDLPQTANTFMSPEVLYDIEQDELGICKQKKPSKFKGLKKLKAKSKVMHLQSEDPPGATSGDYMSEAAKAEWLAAQKDEQAIAGLEDEEEDGDTDSLMEWWYTVEQWDEVPSDEEDKTLKEDESKSFTILADKVYRGLRVFNKVFTERAEVLWQSIIMLHSIAENISTVHQKAKIAGITGGTTTAVGGVAAIAGLALAPFTFGTSLVITAVGVGVATAGGITSASAAISDNVNNMHDRKKVETILQEYEGHLLDIGKILHFVNQGLYKLRGHPFLRSGTQHYSEDWEIRKAVQMISLVDMPVIRAVEVTDSAIVSVQGLFKGMDKYFIKDSRELKKGCKKEIVGEIKEVANILNDAIVTLNAIREELQEATGSI